MGDPYTDNSPYLMVNHELFMVIIKLEVVNEYGSPIHHYLVGCSIIIVGHYPLLVATY